MFTNDFKSPLFLAGGITADNLKQLRFDEKKSIKTIHGDASDKLIRKLFLKDKDKNDITKIEASNDNAGQEIQLEEGEEIIGIYGNKNNDNCFYNLGFIVWTPHFD